MTSNKNFLFFDNKFDFILINNSIYIENVFYFKSILGEYQTVEEIALDVIEKINLKVPIKNKELFENEIKSSSSMSTIKKTLLNLYNNPDLIENLSIEKIKNTINDFELDIEVDCDELVFDPKKKKDILWVLSDCCVKSSTTDIKYIANSKRKINSN